MSTLHSVPSSRTLCQPVLIASTSDKKYRFGVPFKVLTKQVGLYCQGLSRCYGVGWAAVMCGTPTCVLSTTTILCSVPGKDNSGVCKHCTAAVILYTCFQLKAT